MFFCEDFALVYGGADDYFISCGDFMV